MSKKYFIGLDQGTTGTTAVILDEDWDLVSQVTCEHTQYYPKPGWVEHDPLQIWEKTKETVGKAIAKAKIDIKDIKAIGIDNQGETVLVWDKNTGIPVYNAIVWQDRRASEAADRLKDEWGDTIREKTGLIVDSYFSALKIKWILENVENAKEKAEEGELIAGTIDSWLIWKMTGGRLHMTDYSTASRTMMLNIHECKWDQDILNKLEIPEKMLPIINPSAMVYEYTDPTCFLDLHIPIAGNAVDQQSALFGQTCFEPGNIKTTYGTGCFMLMNTGDKIIYSPNGLLTTIAWGLGDKITFALDGGVYIAGAAIKWLQDGIGIIKDATETEVLANSVEDTGDVYFVPAFVGLAAPYWDQYARGTIIGITGGTTKAHIVRATLESIAFQVNEILKVMREDSNIPINIMRADGGPTNNKFLMQFQADILGIPVDVPVISETTALGAAYLAGLGIGEFSDLDEIKKKWKLAKRYEPKMPESRRSYLCERWQKAVERARDWAEK